MSLFKTRSFWTAESGDDESFDQNSMISTCLNGDSDYIITGSHNGVLRIYKPSCLVTDNDLNGFMPTDLVLEKIFDQPILQIGCGRFVSGSHNYQTAVLSPRRISIHLLKIKEGQTEHGTQNTLETLYEHRLQRSAANFTVGQFGGSRNRDFLCVQSLDGMLSFFEQENPTFDCFLPDFLLPSPMAYVKKIDCFIMGNSNWNLVAYRYNSLSEGGEQFKSGSNSASKVVPIWSYYLGEPILDMTVVEDAANKSSLIIIFGERNLFCLSESGRLNFMKKLESSPICWQVYTIKDKIYSLVVTETSNLFVYENTTLKWSAKLQFMPVCIRRAFFRSVKGALVLLSDNGRLECCYLGTEPNLFVAPPLSERELDLEKVEEELEKLNVIIKDSYGNDLKFANQNHEKEISIKINVDQDLLPCKHETNIKDANNLKMCHIQIEVVPKMAFEEVQISVTASKPIKITPGTQFFISPEEAMSHQCYAYLDEDLEVPSLYVHVIVTAISSLGVPRCFNRSAMLPLKLTIESCTAQKDGDHKVILNVNQNVVPLLNLFPEFAEETKTTSAIAFKSITNAGEPVTILLAKSSERYRIQSSSLSSLSFITEQMIYRLNNYYRNVDEFRIIYNSALPSSEVASIVKEHFTCRQDAIKLETSLEQLGAQFRTIQKRLIFKFKVKNPTPLANLEILMRDTFSEIMDTARKLKEANEKLSATQVKLACVLNLAGNLIKVMNIEENLKENLVSVFCPSVDDFESQNWEDVMDATLSYLLRTSLAKSEKDKLRISQSVIEKVTDVTKLEKHLAQVLDRISKFDNKEPEQTHEEIVDQSDTTLEPEKEQTLGNQFGHASLRLLSARKSLLRRRHKNDDIEE